MTSRSTALLPALVIAPCALLGYRSAEKPPDDEPATPLLVVDRVLKRTLRTPDVKPEISMPLDMANTDYEGRVLVFDLAAAPSEPRPSDGYESASQLQHECEDLLAREESARRRAAGEGGLRIELPATLRSALEPLGNAEADRP